jgi:hypothetical protein
METAFITYYLGWLVLKKGQLESRIKYPAVNLLFQNQTIFNFIFVTIRLPPLAAGTELTSVPSYDTTTWPVPVMVPFFTAIR